MESLNQIQFIQRNKHKPNINAMQNYKMKMMSEDMYSHCYKNRMSLGLNND